MENNIDKDIEKVKGIKRCSLTGGFDKQTERLNAISRIIAIVKNNRMAFEKQTENLREVEAERDNFKSELETYKKIVETAEKIKCRDVSLEHCNKYKDSECSKCIIDWARKEVLKDE